VMPRAQALARKALEIDAQLGEAHCSLAMIENAWEWNSRQAQIEFHRCLELNPNYAMAITKYATSYLSPIGRLEEAAEWLERALALDPLSPFVQADYALNSVYRGLDEEFERKVAPVLDNDPALVKVHWFLAYSRAIRGNWSGAVDAAECALRHFPEDAVTLGNSAGVHAWCGNAARASELRSKLEFLAQIRYVPNTALAFAYNVPGDEEVYYNFMHRAVAERDPMARTLRLMRRFLLVASDLRFDGLLEKVALSDHHVAQAAAVDLAG
jgi:tetratricopeptide (TPR) repeat protein